MGFLNSEFSDTVLWNTAAIPHMSFPYFSLSPSLFFFTRRALQLISNLGAQLVEFYKAPVYNKNDKRKPYNQI